MRLALRVSIIAGSSAPQRSCASVAFGPGAEVLLAGSARRSSLLGLPGNRAARPGCNGPPGRATLIRDLYTPALGDPLDPLGLLELPEPDELPPIPGQGPECRARAAGIEREAAGGELGARSVELGARVVDVDPVAA